MLIYLPLVVLPYLESVSAEASIYVSTFIWQLVKAYPTRVPLCTTGILADEMGLGKTLQSISILAYMKDFQKVRCQ